jgi:aminoglycoside phosphotransferase family enzyme
VRDGHGDLRAEHVLLGEGGEIRIVDCAESDSDLAFLVTDFAARAYSL